jgi:hypothetical protein
MSKANKHEISQLLSPLTASTASTVSQPHLVEGSSSSTSLERKVAKVDAFDIKASPCSKKRTQLKRPGTTD